MRKIALPLGVVIGLLIGALWFTPAANANRPCHNKLCSASFLLRPHERRFWMPKTRFSPSEQIFVRIEVKGKVLAPSRFACGAQWNYLGAVVLACPRGNRLWFMFTDVAAHRVRVHVLWEGLNVGEGGGV